MGGSDDYRENRNIKDTGLMADKITELKCNRGGKDLWLTSTDL